MPNNSTTRTIETCNATVQNTRQSLRPDGGESVSPPSFGQLLSEAQNLRPMQDFILAVVAEGGPFTIGEIEDGLLDLSYDKVNRSTLRENLQTLAHHGLIDVSEHDGRSHEFRICERGRRVMQAKRAVLADAFDDGDGTNGGDA